MNFQFALLLLVCAGIKEIIQDTEIVNINQTHIYTTLTDMHIDLTDSELTLYPPPGLPFPPSEMIPGWDNLTPEFTTSIHDIVVYNGEIYVGGTFTIPGNPAINNLARWDGCEWHFVVDIGWVYELHVHGDELYIGGLFTDAGGNPDGDYICIWNGSSIDALSQGLNNPVAEIAVAPYGVIVAGWFTDAGGNPDADWIASWDGSNWIAMGSGLTGVNDFAIALEVIGNDTYVGGWFTTIGGISSPHIARWDGVNWYAVGNGLNGHVWDLLSRDNVLFVAGQFTEAGGNPDANKVTLWDGNAWDNLGSEFPTGIVGVAWSMCLYEDYLYVGYSYDGIIHRWDLTAEIWDEFPPDYPGLLFIQAMVWNGNEFFVGAGNGDGTSGSLWRWGEQSITITITDVPDTICLEDPPFHLPIIQSGYPGNWSGIGVNNNIFDPFDPGTYQLIFTPDIPCATGVAIEVEVVWYQKFYLDLPPVICESSPPLDLPNIIWGVSGNWSGQGVVNNTFNPEGLNGIVTLTFTPNIGQCVGITSGTIAIQPAIVPEVSGVPASVCESDNPYFLPQIQDGISGSWSGQGVVNNIFNPAGLTGIVQLDFTPDAGQCAEPASTEIDVLPSVTPVISGIPDSLCQTDNAILLPTTLSDISGDWSGQGVSNNMFNPAGLNGDIVLTFTPDITQCAETVTTDITVESATIPLISGIPDSMCQSDDAIPLPTLQDGFSGDWSGPGVINNIFNPAGLSGLITLSFAPDTGQCAMVALHGIDVAPPIPPVISGIPSTLCEYSDPISLPTLQNGIIGNWSGQGVSLNTFDPVGLTGDIVLTFTPDAGQCATIATTSISVTDIFVPQISGVPSSLCELSEPLALPIVQDGVSGDWSGPGVVNNTFDPAEQSGIVILTFTPGAGQCADTATTDILIEAVFTPVITGVPDALCQADSTLLLPTIVDNIEGTWSGQGVIDNMFNPAGLLGEIPLLFTPGDDQCAEEATAEITVYEAITPFIQGIPDGMCQADESIILPGDIDGITGNWSGDGVTNNTFDPNGLSGLVILTFIPAPDQCANAVSEAITVTQVIVPDISGIPNALCQGDDMIALPDVMDGISGNWSGPGVMENMFEPEGQFGAVTITFIPDEEECSVPASAEIIVHTSPAFINLSATCDSITQTYTVSFDIQGGDPLSYTVNGNPAGGSSFLSAPISANSMNYTFILDDANACGPVAINGSVNCACATHAGTMSFTGEPMKICEGSGFTVMHLGNAILDADDILEYVLHDQAGTQLGTILATSLSPSFGFPSGVNLGQVYYVSAIAGTNSGTGNVDLSDECLSVSQGVPVLFYKPEVALSAGTEICVDECITYSVLLSGVRPFVFSYQVFADDTSFTQSLVSNTEFATITLCPASFGITSGTLDIQPLTLSDANCIITLATQPNVATTIHGHSLALISHGICPGEFVLVNGILYDQSNRTGMEILEGANAFGCDSVIEINLWALEPAMLDITRTLCEGTSLVINGTEYNSDRPSGIEVIEGGSINGCDSIITISLSFDSIIVENISPVLCADESLLVNGTIYDIINPSGTEVIPGGSVSGCDSVVNIALAFYPPAVLTLDEILCPGDSLIINGTVYDKDNVAGTELIPESSVHGCDSIIEVSIAFYPEAIGSVTDTLSLGDSIVVAGVLFNAAHPVGTVVIPGGNVSGCDSIVEVALYFRSQLSVLIEVIDPVCPGESGAIILEELYGGSFPLTLVLDGSDTVLVSALPHILQNLDGGMHDIWVRDAAAYTLQMQIAIQVPSSLTLDAGVDQIIVEGSNAILHGTANFEVISWQWSPPDFLSCTACADPIVIHPTQSNTYTVIATDLNGCTVSDDVTVSLEKEAEIFVPNVFTPNGDGVNDTWTLYSEDVDARIRQLVIYDRWGGIMFSRNDTAVNDPAAGWDGIVNGSQINPGVYVFRAELVNSEGKVTSLHGDITLFW